MSPRLMSAIECADVVFAYGSNMDTKDLARWALENGRPKPRICADTVGELRGYRRIWNYWSEARQGGAANVRIAPGESVWGILLSVDSTTLETVDLKEGHPQRYTRAPREIPVWCPALGRTVYAWLYTVTMAYERPTPILPTSDYLELMIRAAEGHGLPLHEIHHLRQTPVQSN